MIESKSNIDSFNSENYHLSIRLSLDGFCFCAKKHLSDEVEIFGDFEFEEDVNLPFNHLKKIEEIYENNKVLSQKFKSVTVSHFNNLTTQVPLPFFSEKHLKNYLQHTVKVLENDYIAYDIIEGCEIANVYIPFVNINNFLLDKYGSFVFKHSATILIEKLQHFCSKKTNQIFINMHKSSMEVIAFKDNVFALYNCFSYQTKNDFIYYILFVAEQLHLDVQKVKFTFLGEIDYKSDIYKTASTYLKYISFYEPSTVSELLNTKMSHRYFTLLNQF